MSTPFITIAVQCHNFQRRFCWMLSSLAQQTQSGLVLVDVAHMENNGQPTTEQVCDKFRELVPIKESLWSDYERFQKRGFVRSKQLQKCTTEWILFSDCDMVYSRDYFEKLYTELQKHPNATYLLASGRKTSDKDPANNLVNTHVQGSAVIIPEAFALAKTIAWRRTKAARGVGNSQIVNVKHGAHGGVYVPEDKNPDKGWGSKKGQDTRSDFRFRGRMRSGGPMVPVDRWFWRKVIHLNHNRDKEVGHHLEEQR